MTLDRREFLGASAAVPLAGASVAGLPVAALRDQFRRELFDEFLPFMDRFIVDHERGGFMCNADRDGTRLSGDKVTWYQGRGLWVYSYLYGHFGREKRYLEVARKALDFLERTRPKDPESMRPIKYDREGRPITGPDPEVYSDLFVAEGLAEYSAAVGQRSYWDEAKRILLHCVRVYDRPDFAAELSRADYLGPNTKPFPGARVGGVWMLLTRLATQMLRMHADAEIEAVGRRAVDAVMGPHYNPAWGLNWELLNHDLTPPKDEFGRQAYLGHAIETFWMIMDEALRRGDRKLFTTASERFHRHVDVAWDDVYGGILDDLIDVDRNLWGQDKYLWAQLEVLIGSLLVVEQTGAEWAAEMFTRMHRYVEDKYALRQRGLPLFIFSADRKATFVRHSNRIENYHLPRYLMLCLEMLERMMQGSGKTR